MKATMIAVEGGFVFWIGEAIDFGPKKGIYRAPINASSFAGDLILGNVTLLLDVAVASGTVYFSTFSQVGFVGADGGASTKIADTNYSYVVSASNNGVFWTNYFASYPTVLRADLDGGNIGLVANTGATAFPHGVFSDNSGTFWVENTRVMRTDGDAGTILATPLVGRNGQIPGIRRVTADNSRVYWTEPSVGPGTASGRVASIAKDGSEDAGAPVVLAASQVEPRVLTLDNTYVYWTDFGSGSGTGSVMRARKDGSQAAETLVTNLDQPLGITNDANAIYFALYTDPGKILRLAK